MLPFSVIVDELEKLGAISDEQARRSLDRYDQLEKARPTLGQVGRYGALGAGVGTLMHVAGNALEGVGMSSLKPRALGAAAVKGAIGMGVVPLAVRALDRRAELATLKKYLSQEHLGDYAVSPNTEAGGLAGPPTGLTKA